MRRILVFAVLLSLVGLSTAVASSFSFQAEDVSSFTTEVSISVPQGPIPFPDTIYVRGDVADGSGILALVRPPNDSVAKKLLVLSTEDIGAQADPEKHYVWKTESAPLAGYLLRGSVSFVLEQKGGLADRLTAGLFRCPEAAPLATLTIGTSPCTPIAVATAPALSSGGQGYRERIVSFGYVDATIPFQSQLRLKIVNRASDGTAVLSTADLDLQWGFLPARESALVITP